MRKFKTTPVDLANLRHYKTRAEECHRLAKYACAEGLWFGTCINAVHSSIALADSLSIFFRRTRYAGTSHDEAIEYYSTLQLNKPNFHNSIQKLGTILSIKNQAEYADETLTEKDATHILKQLDRFREFILKILPSD